MHSPVLATSEHRSPHRSPPRTPSPIGLDTVVASEVDEWEASASIRRRQPNGVLDNVRSTANAHPLAIEVPPDDP
jgi:hypothetical protein